MLGRRTTVKNSSVGVPSQPGNLTLVISLPVAACNTTRAGTLGSGESKGWHPFSVRIVMAPAWLVAIVDSCSFPKESIDERERSKTVNRIAANFTDSPFLTWRPNGEITSRPRCCQILERGYFRSGLLTGYALQVSLSRLNFISKWPR